MLLIPAMVVKIFAHVIARLDFDRAPKQILVSRELEYAEKTNHFVVFDLKKKANFAPFFD